MASTAYLRDPHPHGELLAFTAADDVWLAPITGGRAWRLTRESAPVAQPRISPDGTVVAYLSQREGHPEVYAADIDSGQVARLTYWGSTKISILGWDAQGRVLVSSNAGQADRSHQTVRALQLRHDGGPALESAEQLGYGAAIGLAVHPSGAAALSTPGSRVPAHWKRYRGGTASQLWLARKPITQVAAPGDWERLLPQDEAGLVDPMWLGDSLLFTSDRAATFPDRSEEQANLWIWEGVLSKKSRRDKGPRQLTHQGVDQGYVRNASTDGECIVWHSRGEIWVLDSLGATPRRLEVTLPGTSPVTLSPKPAKNLTDLVPDHGGDSSLVGWRGKSFVLTHREGPAHALVADSGVRTREPVLLGTTGRAALVTDAAGEDSIEIHTLDGTGEPQRLLTGALGRVLHLAADPAGERLAAISHDGRVRLITLGKKPIVRNVARSGFGEALSPSFSPDGRYLMWTQPTDVESTMHQVMMLDTRGKHEPVALTSGRFHDDSPAFTRDGKFVALLSNRTFDPHYDAHEFALSFSGATRPWLIPLSATEPPPFGPSAQGWRISKADEAKAKDGESKDEDAPPASPDLDAEGAEDRIVSFPVPSGDYRDLRTASGGVLWIKVADVSVLGTRRAGVPGEQPGDELVRWAFEERKETTLLEKVDSYAVSGDGERLVARASEDVTVLPATRKAEDEDAEKVTVDLSRLRVEIDPQAEWHQMFDENARLMRDHYWREDMNGVDWDGVVARWRPVVDKVRTADDFADMLWETVAELNTSHAYVMPPREDAPGLDRKLGFLGADLEPAKQGWRIARILPSESSDPEAYSPLRAAGVDAQLGDLILAVDGQAVDPVAGPAKQLIGAAGKPVSLTLGRSGQAPRRVVVVPLADESTLRYQDWVRSCREYVAEKSGGRLGYLHVPDMTSTGWAQLHRDLRRATRAEGVIADVRYNSGGHTSQLVIARLGARVAAWNQARYEERMGTYPDNAPRGPVVLVTNRNAGSDGDIVNAAAQALQIGPVVGERTWGGVVGIDGRFDLVDGTVVTQPRYSFWIEGKGWGVENHGVDPDIEVIDDPAHMLRAEDPQLDRAIAEAFARLEQTPASQPPELSEPQVRR